MMNDQIPRDAGLPELIAVMNEMRTEMRTDNKRLEHKLDEVREQQNDWRISAMQYRAEVESRITKLEEQTKNLSRILWFASTIAAAAFIEAAVFLVARFT